MNLFTTGIEKISLYTKDIVEIAIDISISQGTYKTKNEKQNNLMYDSEAFLPTEPWREPNQEELNAICSTNKPFSNLNYVTKSNLEDEKLQPLRDYIESKNRNPEQLSNQIEINNLSKGVIKMLSDQYYFNEEVVINGLAINPPKLKTVTYDKKNEIYLGLHLDSWEGFPLERRCYSKNRISINIGNQDRYLLFINLPLVTIANLLTKSLNEAKQIPKQKLCKMFMLEYPEYPVIRLKIKPSEYYIAPTDNLIHDGSTIDSIEQVLHYTIRGEFKIY